MSEWWMLIAAFWAALLFDCVKIFPARWRRVFIAGAWGRTPRLRKKIRALARARHARVAVSPPLPVAWQAFADDLPFSFSPEGICNVTVGSVGAAPPELRVARSWKWQDIRSVEKKGGRLWINDRDFCAVTGYADAAELWALSSKCARLGDDARAVFLENVLRGWFRPSHLRRALARVGARTVTLAIFASINAIIALSLSVYFLAGGPDVVGDAWAKYIVRMLPMIGLYAAVIHVAALVFAWLAHRKLAPGRGAQRMSILFGAAFLPPQVFRLRAQIAAATLPAQHPLVWLAAIGSAGAFRKRASLALRDLRWPLAPARNPDRQITERIAEWMRGRVMIEAGRLLVLRKITADELLAAPEADGAESRSYCPRCRDQFTKPDGYCSCGIKLMPLKKERRGLCGDGFCR